MRALGPGAAFRASLALFVQRPLASLSLGLALVTSLLAVCCGLGVLTAPWFLGELFALQIALGTGTRVKRTQAWLWAFVVQMVAVLILCAVLGLALLSMGPDVVLGGAQGSGMALASSASRSIAVWLVAGAFTLSLTVYFEHAPALLLDRGGQLSFALLESTRLVAESGALRTWFTSGIAHGLQLAPIVIGVVLAAAFGTLSSTLLWGLLLLPLAALSVAIGQGMVVASYLSLRPHAVDPARVPEQPAVSTSRVLLWTLLLLSVLSGPAMVGGALLRPAQPAASPHTPSGRLLDDIHVEPSRKRERFIPDTALTVEVSEQQVRVRASDGGGTGVIPLPRGKITRVRVRRPGILPQEIVRDGLGTSIFALDIALHDGRAFTTWINDAGVRLDDSLTRRLSSLLSPWMMVSLALCLLWTAVWVSLALPPQGRLRKQLSERLTPAPSPARPSRSGRESSAPPVPAACDPQACGELDRLLRRRTWIAAAWLLPPALLSIAIGLWAALGKGRLGP